MVGLITESNPLLLSDTALAGSLQHAVSGILPLEDAVKMIINCGTFLCDAWGSEKGVMMAIEAELRDVEKLLAETSVTFKAKGSRPASHVTTATGVK